MKDTLYDTLYGYLIWEIGVLLKIGFILFRCILHYFIHLKFIRFSSLHCYLPV